MIKKSILKILVGVFCIVSCSPLCATLEKTFSASNQYPSEATIAERALIDELKLAGLLSAASSGRLSLKTFQQAARTIPSLAQKIVPSTRNS